MIPRNDHGSSPTNARMPGAPPERRHSLRYRLRDASGSMYWSLADEPISCKISIIDLSGAGAAVLADRGPPAGQPVSIRLDSGALGPQPLPAKVISTSVDSCGKLVVRMQFTTWASVGSVLEQHEEHRLWRRFPVRDKSAALAWSDQDGEHAVPCELLNISGGGAAVFAETELPDGHRLRLTLKAGSTALTPVESVLVATSIDVSGLRIARLRFIEPCPIEVFELAVNGS